MAEKTDRKPSRTRKRSWQPPKIKTGQLFESNSLACGKAITMPNDPCQQMPQLS